MNIDDPKLTSFALGEIQGKERASLQKEIDRNPELQDEVAATIKLGNHLQKKLQAECAALRLDDEKRLSLLARPKPEPANPLPAFIPFFGTAIAASLALALWIATRAPDDQERAALASAPDSSPRELLTPEITISFMLGENDTTDPNLSRNSHGRSSSPSLPDPSLIHQTPAQPSPAAGPELAAAMHRSKTEEHPAAIGSLGRQYAQFDARPKQGTSNGSSLPGSRSGFIAVSEAPLMGLSMTAVGDSSSFHRLRKALHEGRIPEPGSIQLEELINHFEYQYPRTGPRKEFAVAIELGECPWAEDHLIAKIDATARAKGNRAPGAVAKTAGLQISFNPDLVAAYRLLGFHGKETEDPSAFLASGEVQPGQRITTLYEIIPARVSSVAEQDTDHIPLADHSEHANDSPPILMGADILYQLPGKASLDRLGPTSASTGRPIDACSDDFRFASAVAAFALHLEGDESARKLSLHEILRMAKSGARTETSAKRRDFINLVETTAKLAQP